MDERDDMKKIETEEKFDIKEIYTPLSVAKEEIWRRLVPTPKICFMFI
jgi:hypothetical protein